MDLMNWFMMLIIVQAFYAFGITGFTYALPDEAQNYVSGFSDLAESINLQSVAQDLQGSIEKQTNVPVLDVGALVFYSGNILIDLLLNFLFALPEMFGLLLNGIMMIFNIDAYIMATLQLFSFVVISAWYFIGIIQLITNIRSGTVA